MTEDGSNDAPATPLLDRSDVRVRHEAGIGGAVRAFLDRVRSGDLGSLPVVVGLIIIWTVFESLNVVFLSSNNLVNLLYDSSTVGVISLGIVCILMVGEIDLSVGSVSGFASAMVGVDEDRDRRAVVTVERRPRCHTRRRVGRGRDPSERVARRRRGRVVGDRRTRYPHAGGGDR